MAPQGVVALQAPDALARCVAALRGGHVLCCPTESFFGLVALARSDKAVRRVLACKGARAPDKAMPLLVASAAAVASVAAWPTWAQCLAEAFWPGPLTMALPARRRFAPGVAAVDGTIGVRVPDVAFLRSLAAAVGEPLTATSANLAGAAPVTSLCDVRLASWEGVLAVQGDAVLHASAHPPRASTVVGWQLGQGVQVLRPGPIGAEQVARIMAAMPRLPTSIDSLWGGGARFEQPLRQHGYRFNLDSVLLFDFVRRWPRSRLVDLGAGVGIIGQLLLLAHKAGGLRAVERQPELAALARSNARRNALIGRATVCTGDVRTTPLTAADQVVFNPPYFEAHAGRPSACTGRDEARRELHGTLADFVSAAARALVDGGYLAAIVPYARRDALRTACAAFGLCCTRSRAVLAFANMPPRHFLLEAQKGVMAPEQRLAPLVVHHLGGGYMPDIEALTRGDPLRAAAEP